MNKDKIEKIKTNIDKCSVADLMCYISYFKSKIKDIHDYSKLYETLVPPEPLSTYSTIISLMEDELFERLLKI